MEKPIVITKKIQKFVVVLPISPDVVPFVSRLELQSWAEHEMQMRGDFASAMKRSIYHYGDDMPEPWPEGLSEDYVLYRYEAFLVPRGGVDGLS